MRNKWPIILLILALIFSVPPVVILAAHYLPTQRGAVDAVSSIPLPSEAPAVSKAVPVEKKPIPPSRVTLLAAGDNLIHDTLYMQAAARAGEGGYDFLPLYKRVADQIAGADLAFINQETMMDASRRPSSYPSFNSPPILAAQLVQAGFDVANLANNHMLDMGLSGLTATAELLDTTPGLTRVGFWPQLAQTGNAPVLERNGIRFAFLGFAEYTNVGGSGMNRDQIVYTDDVPEITRQITDARAHADVVVVSVHFGTENTTTPNARQRETVQLFADLGADIILGHHPHVIQPIEVLQAQDGRKTLTFYSLGNFVSAQKLPANLIGLMPEITIEKDAASKKVSIHAKANPVVTHYGAGFRDLGIYPLEDYTAELAQSHGVNGFGNGAFNMDFINRILSDTMDPLYWKSPVSASSAAVSPSTPQPS